MIRVSNTIAPAGHQHNGSNGRRGLDRRGDLSAAGVRHSQIQQNDSERFPSMTGRLERLDTRLPTVRNGHLVTIGLEDSPHRPQDARIIVHDQNA
jgi:hypothetical protein